MPSPCPGMNPFLEQEDAWGDFHESFITAIRDNLTAQIRPHYIAKIEHRLYIHELPDFEHHSFLEIRDRASRQLVTVIEMLSPSNKYSGADRDQYLAKRNQILLSDVHLVELDLLRGGPRLPVRDLPKCDYFILVSRKDTRPQVDLWPLRLSDPLPVVPIPLLAGTPDAAIDLKSILDGVYDRAAYGDYIYLATPDPPLTPEQITWAKQYIPNP